MQDTVHSLVWLAIGFALVNVAHSLEAQNNFRYLAQTPLSTAPTFDTEDTPWGLTTYANIPYLPCLSKRDGLKYDIAVLGAPFDTVSAAPSAENSPSTNHLPQATTGRPGARFGPGAIRSGSSRIYADAAWSLYTGEPSHQHQQTLDAQSTDKIQGRTSSKATSKLSTAETSQ